MLKLLLALAATASVYSNSIYYDVDVRAHKIHFRAHVPQGLFPIEGTGDLNALASYGNSLTHEALLISALPQEAGREVPITALESRGFELDPLSSRLPAGERERSFIFSRVRPVIGEPKYLVYSIRPGQAENFELQLFSDSEQILLLAKDVLENFKVISEPHSAVEIANFIGAAVTGFVILFLVLGAFLRTKESPLSGAL